MKYYRKLFIVYTVCQSVLHPICIVQCHVATDLCYSGDTALSALEGDEFQCSRDETSQKLLYNVAVLTYICFGAGGGGKKYPRQLLS